MIKIIPVVLPVIPICSTLAVPARPGTSPATCSLRPSLTKSLAREPRTIEKVKAVLEKHPWYANQWQARLQDVPVADRDMVLVYAGGQVGRRYSHQGQAAHHSPWHYINWPFKPEGQPASVQIRDPEPVNILTAMAENESVGEERERSRAKGNRTRVALSSGGRHTPAATHGAAIHC